MACVSRIWRNALRDGYPSYAKRSGPDILIGVFHAGKESVRQVDFYNEDATMDIARDVPGFDAILIGHDHRRFCGTVTNAEGQPVWIVNPANNGVMVGDIDIRLSKLGDRVVRKRVTARLVRTGYYGVSHDFMERFRPAYDAVKDYVSQRIGTMAETLSTEPAYFGPSAFVDFIHGLQLDITRADISFCAPLSYDAVIRAGDIHMRDMFNLYRYENMLYTMRLTGREVKDYLNIPTPSGRTRCIRLLTTSCSSHPSMLPGVGWVSKTLPSTSTLRPVSATRST